MFAPFIANVYIVSDRLYEYDNCKIISCGSDLSIDIKYAYYGIEYWCAASNEEEILDRKCFGKQFCKICASNKWFGDPCIGTLKYLFYSYDCIRKWPTSRYVISVKWINASNVLFWLCVIRHILCPFVC